MMRICLAMRLWISWSHGVALPPLKEKKSHWQWIHSFLDKENRRVFSKMEWNLFVLSETAMPPNPKDYAVNVFENIYASVIYHWVARHRWKMVCISILESWRFFWLPLCESRSYFGNYEKYVVFKRKVELLIRRSPHKGIHSVVPFFQKVPGFVMFGTHPVLFMGEKSLAFIETLEVRNYPL